MFRKLFLMTVVAAIGLGSGLGAFGQDAGSVAAALDKTKHKKKEKTKHGVTYSYEFYIDMKNVPAVRAAADYSGAYGDMNGGGRPELRVSANGEASGSGVDSTGGVERWNDSRSYTLRNARVTGAVLVGEKVFGDGTVERLEAVFVNRTTSTGKNASEIEESRIEFGIGWMQTGKDWTNRVFLPLD